MSTHPYIPLFVDDFDAAVVHLTMEEECIYGRLLRLSWRTPGCSLPNDPAWIARKVRLSAEDFDRVAKPVLDEFFTVLRGRLIQKRLKREYDDISRKKTARKLAGKKGGEAKALKSQEKTPSNASVLPADTRAFPDPYPYPDPEPEEEKVRSLFPAPTDESAAAVSGQAARPKGARLKADWKPSADNVAYAISQGFSAEQVDRVADDFRDFWTAKSGADASKLDWSATWRRWVRNTDRKIVARTTAPKRVGFV